MRSPDVQQLGMFSYVSVEDRVPPDHPIRKLRILVDAILGELDELLAARYAAGGRPSIPPERILRASLLKVVYSVRSERLLMEQLNYNLLFRWFVGLNIDAPVWDHSTFSFNRQRLFDEAIAQHDRLGYVTSFGAWHSYIHAVGVPFRPRDGSPLVAITCGGIAEIVPEDRAHSEIGPALVKLAENLALLLEGERA